MAFETAEQEILTAVPASMFKYNDLPMEIKGGQEDIFYAILDPMLKRIWITAYTQYGKTLTVALAATILASTYHKKVKILSAKDEQAKIMMRYILEHIQDNADFLVGLIDVDAVSKRQTAFSSNRLAWSHGGEIEVKSAEAKAKRGGQGLLGSGGDVVIIDESPLVPDEHYQYIQRMLGRNKDTRLIEIGNCIERNHFMRSYEDPAYHIIRIDYHQGIAEGRITEAFIEEIKTGHNAVTSKFFKSMYECVFPQENEFTYFKPTKYSIMPNIVEYYGACDPALGEMGKTDKGCDAGIVVLGLDENGKIYEVESIVKNMTPETLMNTILSLPYKFARFGVEAVAFQKFFLKEMEKKSQQIGKYIPFEEIQQKEKKEKRIESLEPFINTAQIEFKGGNPLFQQMQDYPYSDKVDGIDTLEMCFRLVQGRESCFVW